MTIVNPTGVPTITFPWQLTPYTNTTPFTTRDGETFLDEFAKFKHWAQYELIPYVDENFTQYIAAFDQAVNAVGQAIADNNATIQAKVDAVNAAIAAATAIRDAAAASAVTAQNYANQASLSGTVDNDVMLGRIPKAVMENPPPYLFGKGLGLSVNTAPLVTNGGTGYVVGDRITLAPGTGTASKHAVVRVSTVGANGVITAVSTYYSGSYTVAPGDTIIAAGASTGAGTGATFNRFNWNVSATDFNVGEYTSILPTAPSIRYTGYSPTPVDLDGSGTYGTPTTKPKFSTWEFDTDAVQLELHFKANASRFSIYVDGRRISPDETTTDATGAFMVYKLYFGGVPTVRYIRIVAYSIGFREVRFLAANNSIFRSPVRTKKLAYSIGDSYMFGTGAHSLAETAYAVMCETLGIDGIPDGVSAARWDDSTAGDSATRIANDLGSLNRAPDLIFYDLGFNNQNTPTDQTVAVAALTAAVTAAQQLYPNATHVAFSPATPVGDTAKLASLRALEATAFAAKNVKFIDVTNWVNTANMAKYTIADNIHPTYTGHAYLGARKAAAVRAAIPNL